MARVCSGNEHLRKSFGGVFFAKVSQSSPVAPFCELGLKTPASAPGLRASVKGLRLQGRHYAGAVSRSKYIE
jgi:hypothetical protein